MKPIPESFKMDHTKVKAPFVRIAHKYQIGNKELTKLDIRFCQPNESKLSGPAMHSMEHKMATVALRQLGDSHIDLSPMGCKTGFYWIINTTEIEDTSLPSLVKELLEEARDIELQGDLLPTEVNCGSYKYHNEELANRYINTFLIGEPCID